MSSLELVIPTSGEVISLDDAAGCLRVLSEIRDLESRLREAKGELTNALAAEFSRQGTKTLEINGMKAELRGGIDVVWEIEILEELRDLGLPEERMDALIQTEVVFRVNANEAKRIASANEAYAEVVNRARKTVPRPSYVSIKQGSHGTNLDPRPGTS